jgi:Flp pilus assembly protein TadG
MHPPSRSLRHVTSGRDSGSAAAELVLITPLLVLMMLFIVAAGRLVNARLQVDSAARQAARAASIAPGPGPAVTDATMTAQSALTGQHTTCATPDVSVDTSDYRPGGQVTVQVTCVVQLSGLSGLHLPGTITVTSRFTSPIDVYRSESFGLPGPGAPGGGTIRTAGPGHG